MGKGGYRGGSTLIGFGKPWFVEPRSATEVEKEREAEAAKLAADKKAARKKLYPSKAERKADRDARQQYRDAPKEVEVEHRAAGVIVGKRIIKRS